MQERMDFIVEDATLQPVRTSAMRVERPPDDSTTLEAIER